jgi:hypothetical protein
MTSWMMRGKVALALALASAAAASARADVVTGYVANPTTNSTDFAAGVAALGGTLNTDVNFNAMPTGTLINNFYTASDGVTLTPSDSSINQVLNGVGPGQGNTFSPPLSSGEGTHPASNFLDSVSPGSGATASLTISFNTPVLGVGLFTVDYFGPDVGTNTLTVEAFTGANGTGTSLGSFNSVNFNFQPNNLYFMGITSSGADIGSLVFTRGTDETGDELGIDNIQFATGGGIVPEPSSLALGLIGSLGALSYSWRRRRRAVQP